MRHNLRKFSLSIIFVFFLFFNLAGTLFFVRPAKAQAAVSVISDIQAAARYTGDKIYRGFKIGIYSAAMNTIQYVTKKLAYDSAVWLASGGKGETPFAHTKSFGDYMTSVGSGAFGTFIDELGKPLGLNLCKIPDVRLDLLLRLGLRKKYFPDEPNCNWEKFTKGWSLETAKSMYGGRDQLAERFNASLKPADTDFGLFVDATERIDNLVATERWKAEKERQEGGGAKGLTDLISGNIKTPAFAMEESYRKETPYNTQNYQTEALNRAFSAGLDELLPSTISVFLNTLLSGMVENFFTKGMLPFGACIGEYGDESCKDQEELPLAEDYFGSGLGSFSGRRRAEQIFSGLLVSVPAPIDKYNVLANFANCPDNPGLENCAVDDGLVTAANRGTMGAPITIKQALDEGLLQGEWKLLPPSRAEDNADKNCYTRAYCYRNMKILRQARVLPLGFEIAAKNSNPDKPWTLNEVVAGFDDCNYAVDNAGAPRLDAKGSQIVIDDPSGHPFCRLIDPNWVLKAPPARCDNFAYNTLPLDQDIPVRQQSCVDLKTCVGYNKDGTCYAYGYCTREQNEWRFNLDKCEEQNRTCRAFTNSSGGTVAYLYRTLNTGYCTADNVGCRAYSLERDMDGNWTEPAGNYNPYIYFNNKLPQSCSSGSAGCSAFKVASSTGTSLYLRKAPYYLGCYAPKDVTLDLLAQDKSLESQFWPKTRADLDKLTPGEECKDYSPACIPEEVGCSWFTPVTYRGAKVPGKFKPAEVNGGEVVAWNDQCDGKCVGYAAYREMPSNYSNGQDVDYIIPSSGSACQAADEGCSSFTNLATTAGGVESVERYSYLRPCITPEPAKQKTFYTYEGKAEGGYQLKVFNLEKDADGSPKYWYRTNSDLANYENICNASGANYKAGTADPDCRQFNDDAGTVYYKLLSKTIAVSAQCTPYRLNNTELEAAPGLNSVECSAKKGFWNNNANNGAGECELCFQNGEYKDGYCFYTGLPGGVETTAGASQVCSAQAESCRAYKGNAGNNIRNVLDENFEAGALFGWTSGANVYLSGESTQQGGHSLGYNGPSVADAFRKEDLWLNPGASYDLTFWAKGDAQGLAVNLRNNATVQLGVVALGDGWRLYHLGPVALGGTVTGTQLSFDLTGPAGNRNVFVDNIQLVEVANYLYLVKNTLKVDPVCDSNLDDNLPGEALGCAEYKDTANKSFYLTGFSTLCRENAIGCTALLDTYNTDDSGIKMYNVWFAGASGATIKKTIAGTEYTCKIPLGEKGCYLNIFGATKAQVITVGGALNTSSVYIPADTPTNTPIYLVASKENTCHEADLGCTLAGQKQSTPAGVTYVTTTIKNDPALYEQITCTQEAEGCGAFNYRGGASYFKDPEATGQKICAYRNGVDVDGTKSNGWFWKGVGKCGGTAAGDDCLGDQDCASPLKCEKKGDWPCYPNYRFDDINYGLWSYGATSSYSGFVGECPAEQSGCTEYVDHNDNNKRNYFIDNEKLKAAQAGCNGQISQRYGCILLDNTELPNKLWNTANSYKASTAQNFALVTPVVSNPNDANLIVKVVRDRGCAEWLQCQNSHREWSSEEGRFKTVCDGVGRCNRLTAVTEQSDATECANWVNGAHDYAGQILSDTVYRTRDVSWGGHDYSGYSIWGQYPAEELEQINLSDIATSSKWSLVKRIPCGGVNCAKNSPPEDYACENLGPCGAGRAGTCQNKICVQTPSGSNNSADFEPVNSPVRQFCRAYPEKDSPFPNNTGLVGSQAFTGATKCDEVFGSTSDAALAGACDCYYQRVNYGDFTTKFWNFYKPNDLGGGTPKATTTASVPSRKESILPGVCVGTGVAKDGKYCEEDEDCKNVFGAGSGTCAHETKQQKFIGRAGYCLEFDESKVINSDPSQHPCLTWLPIDQLSGVPDINNQFTDAGFDPQSTDMGSPGYTPDGPFYCVRSGRWEYRKTYKIKTSGVWDNNGSGQVLIDTLWKPMGQSLQQTPQQVFDIITGSGSVPNAGGCIGVNGAVFTKLILPPPVAVCPGNLGYEPKNFKWDSFTASPISESGNNLEVISNHDKTTLQSYSCDTEVEDIYTMEYECVPKGGDGWYKVDESYTQANDQYSIPIGDSYGPGRKFPVGIDWDSAENPLPTGYEVNEVMCEALYQAGKNGEAKAFTNEIWSKSTETLIPPECRPGGALGLKSEPGGGKNITIGLGGSCFTGTRQTPVSMYSTTGGVVKSGRTAVEGYFAKLFGLWGLETALNPSDPVAALEYKVYDGSYESNPGTGLKNIGGDQAYSLGKTAPPVIMPVLSGESDCKANPNGSGQLCKEGPSGAGFTINNKTEGDVKVTGRPAKVNLKFFAFADKDHMPLRRVMINWGDGNIAPRDGYFRNHRGARQGKCLIVNDSMPDKKLCYGYAYERGSMPPLENGNTTRVLADEKALADGGYKVRTELSCYDDTDCKFTPQCVNQDDSPLFSFMLDKTCDSSYFYQEYTYNCRKNSPEYESTCGAYAAEFPQGCCIYQPKVQVLDNWGWCNGDCEGEGQGCYDGKIVAVDAEDFCAPNSADVWTSYKDKVYVKPL